MLAVTRYIGCDDSFSQDRIMRIFSLLLLLVMTSTVHSDETWQLPPQEVVDIIDAAPEPVVGFSPDSKWMLYLDLSLIHI